MIHTKTLARKLEKHFKKVMRAQANVQPEIWNIRFLVNDGYIYALADISYYWAGDEFHRLITHKDMIFTPMPQTDFLIWKSPIFPIL